PRRALIEAKARRLRELLSSGEAAFPAREAEYWKLAEDLSRTIFGPVASQLGKKRLLIVAEGALQYLPFAALPLPTAAGREVTANAGNIRPMIEDHEIVSLPSASIVSAIRAGAATRGRAMRQVAVFADPVFDRDDERFETSPPVESRTGAQVESRTRAQVEASRSDQA